MEPVRRNLCNRSTIWWDGHLSPRMLQPGRLRDKPRGQVAPSPFYRACELASGVLESKDRASWASPPVSVSGLTRIHSQLCSPGPDR